MTTTTAPALPREIDEDWEDEVAELSAAEEFLNYFEIPFDQTVVHVNRLHILQRFHNYLTEAADDLPDAPEPRWAVFAKLLERAYNDFVESDALTEKVFKVFQTPGGCETFVSSDSLLGGGTGGGCGS